MADEIISRDQNYVTVLAGITDDSAQEIRMFRVDPLTGRLKASITGGGTGTVTSVSVVSANGFAGTVATATTTPAITISTTITGIIKGNGTAISAATAGTDYANLAFKTIAVSGQSDVVATSAADTLTFVGSGVTITTNAATRTVTFTTSGTSLVVGTTAITSGTSTRILYDNAGTLGEYTITGTGTVVAMQTSPSLVTSLLMDSGFVMNWASSNVVLTHSSGILTLGTGEMRITTAGTNAASVITQGSINTLSNKSLNGVTMVDGTNIILNTTTGTKIGTATTQKLGFFNATPIVQPTGDVITALQNLGLGASLTVAATTITSRTLWGQTYDGSANVTGSLTSVGNITGGASSMTILAGTGASRTLTLQTTSGASAAQTNITLNADQSTTFSGTLAMGSNSITMTGSLAATGARVTKGWFTDVESTNMITINGTSLSSATVTFSNKRITRRLTTTNAPGATPTTNTDNVDVMNFTGLNTAITSMTTNLSGTPNDGDLLEFRFLDDGTARAITWGTSFASTTVTLPTTTVISTCLRVGFEWRAASSKWECIATC